MTRSRLVTKNLLRNRQRTLLTIASVAASALLLSVFCATYRYLDAPLTPAGFQLLLMVGPRTSLMMPLPLSYGERISRLPGVVAVSPVNMVDTVYGGDEARIWALAFNPETLFKIYTDWQLSADQRQAFAREQTAVIAGRKMAAKFAWRIGDRIRLRSPGYHVDLDLVLRGIYSSSEDESLLAFHWAYLNAAQGYLNKPGGFWVRVGSAEDVPRLVTAIDEEFRNAGVETRTLPMTQWVLDFIGMLGNVKRILLAVSAVVIFADLLIVANEVAMSIRERTAEVAVLRALGFRTRQLLGLLGAESLAVCLAGAFSGYLAAFIVLTFTAGYQIGGAMPVYIQVDGVTLGVVLLAALAISVVSTLVPAYRATHTSLAQSLRFVG